MAEHFRAHPREPSAFGATLWAASGTSVEARARDLSLGGVGLEITQSLSPVVALELLPGRAIEVELAVPTFWDPVRFSGEVLWVRDGGPRARGKLLLGIRFRFGTPGELAPLTRFLGRGDDRGPL